jgi:hypothetical protein
MSLEDDLLGLDCTFGAMLPVRAASSLSLDTASSVASDERSDVPAVRPKKRRKEETAAGGVGRGGGRKQKKAPTSGYESGGEVPKPVFAARSCGPVFYSRALDFA